MKIKLDENMPVDLADVLSRLGHDADTVPHEGLAGKDDAAVWDAAQSAGRLLVTQDLDFRDSPRFRPGTHHGLVLVRLKNAGRQQLIDRVATVFERETIDTWTACYVVVSHDRVRVRRPTS